MWTSSAPPRATSTAARRVALIGTNRGLEALAVLGEEYARQGHSVLWVARPAPCAPEELVEMASDVDAMVVLAPRARSPRTMVSGPTVRPPDGRAVPVGVLPDRGPEALGRFASACARVHRRRGPTSASSVALLAQRSGRYRNLAARIARLLAERAHQLPVWWWTADELIRDDMLEGLGYGVGLALYVGHGRPVGWVGYRGTRAHHCLDFDEPVGAILSLACLTASRRRTGLSFAEALPLQGAAAATLGAVTETSHLGNARWAVHLVAGLASGLDTLGDLVVAAEMEGELVRQYRILGDPLAPLLDAPGTIEAASALTRRTALLAV